MDPVPEQLSVFDTIQPIPATRRAGPLSSIVAEENMQKSGKLAKQRTVCYLAVKDHPGKTAMELAHLCGRHRLDRYAFNRRLSELSKPNVNLVRRGAARLCKITGTLMTTWEAV